MAGKAADRICRMTDAINKTCFRIGRAPEEIRLMAVSKTQPLEAVEEVWKLGLRLFGENRVQESVNKFSQFKERAEAEIHFIGNLQRNKAKKAVEFFDCIQSVDRDSLIDELGTLTNGREKPLMIFFEYHTGEESKAGFPDMDSLCRAAEKVLAFPGLKPVGLMTMAPFTADKKAVRVSFRSCRKAAEELAKRFPESGWRCLSMGMSGDFDIAIEEGSTLLRIGTGIFGDRTL